MILAGVDEAGLGPSIGPLCVAITAFHVPEGVSPSWLWEALILPRVSESRQNGGAGSKEKKRRFFPPSSCCGSSLRHPSILIADSKILYRRSGMAGLERGVLAFLAQTPAGLRFLKENRGELSNGDLATFLRLFGVDPSCREGIPWYQKEGWKIPGWISPTEWADDQAFLHDALTSTGLGVAMIQARILPARELNHRFAKGMNKAEVLLEVTGELLQHLATTFPEENLAITLDRQGGRIYYAPWLSACFGGRWIETVTESPEKSLYRVVDASATKHQVEIVVCPKAERHSFCVALASMVAKYLRERFMADLNGWFMERIQGLAPTAGYPGDAPRFLEKVLPFLHEKGVDPHLLLRMR